MPQKPKQYCKHPGCNVLVDSGYCPRHKPPTPPGDKQRNKVDSKIYDRTWRKLRAMKLRRNPLCEVCLSKGLTVLATEVDHIKPVKKYPELRLVYDNLQSLCKSCHSKKTRRENRNKDY